MSGILNAQIDWIPIGLGAVRPTQGKTRAVMQVSDGSQVTLPTRDVNGCLVDRCSQREEAVDELSKRVNQRVS